MKMARRITRTAHLLGAAGFALLLVGCADQQPTAPQRPKLKLAPTGGPTTVSSVITLADGKNVTKVQRLRTAMKGGVAYSMVITDPDAVAAGYTQPLTPVLAVSEGLAVGNYNQMIVNEQTGERYRLSATGPMIYNYPVTDAIVYKGTTTTRVAEIHFKWTPVSGGYALLAQKQVSYSSTGAVTATVISTVTSPATYALGESPPISERFGSLLADVKCYFAPKVAYAQGKKVGPTKDTVGLDPATPFLMPVPGSECWGQAGVLALNTGVIAVESWFGVLMIWELPLYLASWVSWTHSLWDYLHCLRKPPRCNQGFCGSGGGSTW
jgi:hypothetical protein